MLAGGGLAWLGWFAQVPASLLLLGLIWRYAAPIGRFAMLVAYYVVLAADLPAAYQQFFPQQAEWHGVVWWVLQALVLAAPALVLRQSWGWGAYLALALLPPWGVITWGSPLLAAGWWFPAGGIAGLVGYWVLNQWLATGRIGSFWQVSVIVAWLLWCGYLHQHQSVTQLPAHWVALNTSEGQYGADAVDNVLRQQRLMRRIAMTLNHGARVVLLPESAANVWSGQSEYWWDAVFRQAARQHAVLLIGASRADARGGWRDVMLLRGAQTGELSSRVPIPVGLWRPFDADRYHPDWWGNGRVTLAGQNAIVSFCYEDMLIFPLLLGRSGHPPAVLLSMADDWFARDRDEPCLQAQSIEWQARLYGLPLLRALNVSKNGSACVTMQKSS